MALITGLGKEGYRDALQSKTSVKVNLNENGNIAQENELVAGSRTFQINTANPNNSLADNNKLLNFFIGLAGGTINETTNKAIVTWEV